MLAKQRHRRPLGFAQQIEGAGQQHRHRAPFAHRPRVLFGGVFEMVGGERAVARRQPRAAQRRELLGVQLHRQAKLDGLIEYARHLRRRKGQMLAEGVHRVRQPVGFHLRQNALANQIDPAVGILFKFRWKGVRRQAGRQHVDGRAFAQLADGAQHAQLARLIQPIARFNLYRGDSFRQQSVKPPARRRHQRRFAGFARGAHRRENAAALRGDLGVADAVEALLELCAAVAAEHQMGMAVDQARRQYAAVEAVLLTRRKIGHLCARPYPHYPVACDRQRAILDDVIFAFAHGDQIGPQPQAVDRFAFRHCAFSRCGRFTPPFKVCICIYNYSR